MNYAPGPMTESDWKLCKRLDRSSKHQWGDVTKIDRSVIFLLDHFLSDIMARALVTCGTQGKHTDGSFHYASDKKLGCAIDFMVPDYDRNNLPDLMFDLLRYGFGGVGIYSEWKLDQKLPAIGGFHVDTRPSLKTALWMKDAKGYKGISLESLKGAFK